MSCWGDTCKAGFSPLLGPDPLLCWAEIVLQSKNSSLQECLLGEGLPQAVSWEAGSACRATSHMAGPSLIWWSPSRRQHRPGRWPTCSTLGKPGSLGLAAVSSGQDEALHADCCFSSCEERFQGSPSDNHRLDLECKYCHRGSERD